MYRQQRPTQRERCRISFLNMKYGSGGSFLREKLLYDLKNQTELILQCDQCPFIYKNVHPMFVWQRDMTRHGQNFIHNQIHIIIIIIFYIHAQHCLLRFFFLSQNKVANNEMTHI